MGKGPVAQDVTIDSYITDLRKALTGPLTPKRDLILEARCSLEDAAESYRADNVAPETAERLAVMDFGDPAEVVQAYQRELAMAQSVRTAWWLLISIVVQFLEAKMSWKSTGAWHGHRRPSEAYLLFSHLWSWGQIVIVAVAAIAAFSFGIGVRYIQTPWRLAPIVGAFALLVLGIKLVVSIAFLLTTPHLVAGIIQQTHTLPNLLFGLLITVSIWMLPNGYVAFSAIRCVTTAKGMSPLLAG